MMKASDAMRLGALLRPQVFGQFFGKTFAGEEGTCAIGAALEAVGVHLGRLSVAAAMPDEWMWMVNTPFTTCHVCGVSRFNNVASVVTHLNDRHHISRNDIADWLATLEPGMAVPVPVTKFSVTERVAELCPAG